MKIKCKNCNHTYTGHFCNNCGQSAETDRLDFHFLWHDIQHGLLHMDKGILYSVRQLLVRPGHSVREFIEGKRVNHFKPISLVIVLATVYGILYHKFHINLFVSDVDNSTINFKELNEWIATHYAWVTLATIPFYTVGTALFFRKQGYNIYEFLILNTFKASQRLIIHIAAFPLVYVYNENPKIKTIFTFLYVIDNVIVFWTNVQFFNKLNKFKTLMLSVLSHLVFLILFIIALMIILLIGDFIQN